MTLVIIGVMASLAAFGGGLLAFRFQDRLHLILGFSAAMLGISGFSLIGLLFFYNYKRKL